LQTKQERWKLLLTRIPGKPGVHFYKFRDRFNKRERRLVILDKRHRQSQTDTI